MIELKKNWVTILASFALSTLGMLLIYFIGFNHESAKAIDTKIENKVDKTDYTLDKEKCLKYIDQQDLSIKDQMKTDKIELRDDIKGLRDDIAQTKTEIIKAIKNK
jgi:hypothetical protein